MTEKKKEAKTKRPTAIKRDIQNEKRRLINKTFKSKTRSSLRALEEKIQEGNKDAAKAAAQDVYSLMDKGVKRKLFKQNKADRTKARAASKLASLLAQS